MDNTAQKLAALQALFPNAGITHGYIGNCGVNRNGPFDDRSWRIFTKVVTMGVWGKTTISVHLNGPDFDVEKVAAQLRLQGVK